MVKVAKWKERRPFVSPCPPAISHAVRTLEIEKQCARLASVVRVARNPTIPLGTCVAHHQMSYAARVPAASTAFPPAIATSDR